MRVPCCWCTRWCHGSSCGVFWGCKVAQKCQFAPLMALIWGYTLLCICIYCCYYYVYYYYIFFDALILMHTPMRSFADSNIYIKYDHQNGSREILSKMLLGTTCMVVFPFINVRISHLLGKPRIIKTPCLRQVCVICGGARRWFGSTSRHQDNWITAQQLQWYHRQVTVKASHNQGWYYFVPVNTPNVAHPRHVYRQEKGFLIVFYTCWNGW